MNSCASGSVCFQLIQGIPTAGVALIVGIVGAFIAVWQAKIAGAKLKLGLFERRYAIFLETWKIMSEVATHGARPKNYGLGNPFSNFIPQARFLFGEKLERYLFDAVGQWTHLHAVEGELAGSTPRVAELAEQQRLLTNWFFDQADTGVKKMFGRYLNFEKWK